MFCPNCGNPVSNTSRFCDKCGFQQVDSVSGYIANSTGGFRREPHDANDTALLALFLGCFGIHDFYCGNSKNGVIKLLLTISIVASVVSAIWAIVDLYRLGDGKYVDGDGVTLKAVPWAKVLVFVQIIFIALTVALCIILIYAVLATIGMANT